MFFQSFGAGWGFVAQGKFINVVRGLHSLTLSDQPLRGLGANNAIISAASFADELRHLNASAEAISESSLQTAFHKYQKTRETSTRGMVKMANLSQLLNALDTPFLKLIQLQVKVD